jgi:hypothetical protein
MNTATSFDAGHVALGHLVHRSQLALSLRALLRQDVVEVGLRGLEAIGSPPEALCSAPFGLELGHYFLLEPGPNRAGIRLDSSFWP